MKIAGYILLIIGILSLIGGIIHPSGADSLVVLIGYLLKLSFIIGGILLISTKPKGANKNIPNNAHLQPYNIETNKQSSTLFAIDKDKETLLSLFSQNVLTVDEYNVKMDELDLRQNELIDKQKNELKAKKEHEEKLLFDAEINKRLQPILAELNELKNSNLLSETEYKEKKEKLISEYNKNLKLEIEAKH